MKKTLAVSVLPLASLLMALAKDRKQAEAEKAVRQAQPRKRLYVVAGNYLQFRVYLDDNKLYERDAIYLSSAEYTRGLRPKKSDVVLFGTWYERSDAAFIEDWYERLEE
jgi:hypothetical protein